MKKQKKQKKTAVEKTVNKPILATPKHVFLHLLMIAMLYASVIAAITLYFQYINYSFYDITLGSKIDMFNGIRWGSAVLLVAYPVLIYITRLIEKELQADPQQQQMRLRRWLLYFTQFVTALTIIIDLMVLIYQFYGGDITVRFVLKVITVLIIAVVVLGYYRWELHRQNRKSSIPKIIASTAGVVLLASLVSGFFIAGTPAQQRAVRLDEERVQNLMLLQEQVLNHVQSKKELPVDVKALTAWVGEMPTDPDTKQTYRYNRKANTSFELCATFATVQTEATTLDEQTMYGMVPVEKTGVQLVGGSSWKHAQGNYCFQRTILLQQQ